MENKPREIYWTSSDHWARRSAMEIIARIWSKASSKPLPRGKSWLETENLIVEIIKNRYENKDKTYE